MFIAQTARTGILALLATAALSAALLPGAPLTAILSSVTTVAHVTRANTTDARVVAGTHLLLIDDQAGRSHAAVTGSGQLEPDLVRTGSSDAHLLRVRGADPVIAAGTADRGEGATSIGSSDAHLLRATVPVQLATPVIVPPAVAPSASTGSSDAHLLRTPAGR